MAGKGGAFRRAWDAAIDFIARKEVVGADKLGNTYFRYFETNRGVKVERREVRWNTSYVMYDPNDIPSEWRMWLRKLRDTPPTIAELSQSEAKAQAMQAKVAVLEEQDRLRRMRMQSMGAHTIMTPLPNHLFEAMWDGPPLQAHQSSQQPDMNHMLQSVTHAGGASNAAADDSAATGKAQGSGDSFTPGAWKP